jgi:hypothetical protein
MKNTHSVFYLQKHSLAHKKSLYRHSCAHARHSFPKVSRSQADERLNASHLSSADELPSEAFPSVVCTGRSNGCPVAYRVTGRVYEAQSFSQTQEMRFDEDFQASVLWIFVLKGVRRLFGRLHSTSYIVRLLRREQFHVLRNGEVYARLLSKYEPFLQLIQVDNPFVHGHQLTCHAPGSYSGVEERTLRPSLPVC